MQEHVYQQRLRDNYRLIIYGNDSEVIVNRSITIISVRLLTSITGEWISTIVRYRIYNSLKQLRRSIWYLIITWLINEGIHITCDCLILQWKISSLWCLTWNRKVGLFMIGLTTYETVSHNKLINKSSDRWEASICCAN